MGDQLETLRQALGKYQELDKVALMITREGHYDVLQNVILQLADVFGHKSVYKNNLKIIVNELIDDAWEFRPPEKIQRSRTPKQMHRYNSEVPVKQIFLTPSNYESRGRSPSGNRGSKSPSKQLGNSKISFNSESSFTHIKGPATFTNAKRGTQEPRPDDSPGPGYYSNLSYDRQTRSPRTIIAKGPSHTTFRIQDDNPGPGHYSPSARYLY